MDALELEVAEAGKKAAEIRCGDSAIVVAEQRFVLHCIGIEGRREARKLIAPGQGEVFESWCTLGHEKGVDLAEGDEHGCPHIGKDLQ
jgi:hypothetical protein